MDTRKLEILKNDTAFMLSLAEPGAGGDIIARMDPSTCNAEALREVKRRHDNFPALVEALEGLLKATRKAHDIAAQSNDVYSDDEALFVGEWMDEAREVLNAAKG